MSTDVDWAQVATQKEFNPFVVYMIYSNPSDYPGLFVLQRWNMARGPGDEVRHTVLAVERDFARIRELVPKGLTRIPRSPTDNPIVVEAWM